MHLSAVFEINAGGIAAIHGTPDDDRPAIGRDGSGRLALDAAANASWGNRAAARIDLPYSPLTSNGALPLGGLCHQHTQAPTVRPEPKPEGDSAHGIALQQGPLAAVHVEEANKGPIDGKVPTGSGKRQPAGRQDTFGR